MEKLVELDLLKQKNKIKDMAQIHGNFKFIQYLKLQIEENRKNVHS